MFPRLSTFNLWKENIINNVNIFEKGNLLLISYGGHQRRRARGKRLYPSSQTEIEKQHKTEGGGERSET